MVVLTQSQETRDKVQCYLFLFGRAMIFKSEGHNPFKGNSINLIDHKAIFLIEQNKNYQNITTYYKVKHCFINFYLLCSTHTVVKYISYCRSQNGQFQYHYHRGETGILCLLQLKTEHRKEQAV